ncbi:MAG: arylesterase [Rhodocyclaceae bacterium]|nr:arylesterase [Rhodocyclaceae bacterium]MCL4757513.1 arylesterase [Rhodocyclaceae bacterium]
MSLRSMALILLISIWTGTASAATILVWGDSLSAGYRLRPGEDWPTLLQTRLRTEGFQHTVVNASVSGETTSGGRSRLPAALAQHRPALLILQLGANDGLRGLRPQMMADNLKAMIETAKTNGIEVLLVGIRIPPNYGPTYTRRFEQVYADLAQGSGVPLVPFLLDGFADQRERFLDDGIHPDAAAQPLILDTVWRHLEPLLSK